MRAVLVLVVVLALLNLAAAAENGLTRRIARRHALRVKHADCGKGDVTTAAGTSQGDPAGTAITAAGCPATVFAACTGADRTLAENLASCDGWGGNNWNHNAKNKGAATNEAALAGKKVILGTSQEINCACDVDSSGGCAHKDWIRLHLAAWSECANYHLINCIAGGKLGAGKVEFAQAPNTIGNKRAVTKNEMCTLYNKCRENPFTAGKGTFTCTPK